jgi:hypothetical protein
MILKLIKHDLKAILPDFYGIYLALIVLSVLGPFVLRVSPEWLIVIYMLVVIGTIIAVGVVTFIALINLFNKRLFSHQGYLNLTLPVSTTSLLGSKIITGMIISILTGFVTAVSFFIFAISITWLTLGDLSRIAPIWDAIVESKILWELGRIYAAFTPLGLANMAYSLALLLFVITFTHTSYVRKNRLMVGIILYVGIGLTLSTIQTNFFNVNLLVGDGDLELLAWALNDIVLYLPRFLASTTVTIHWLNLLMMTGLYVAITGIFFSLSQYLIEHKIEVE